MQLDIDCQPMTDDGIGPDFAKNHGLWFISVYEGTSFQGYLHKDLKIRGSVLNSENGEYNGRYHTIERAGCR